VNSIALRPPFNNREASAANSVYETAKLPWRHPAACVPAGRECSRLLAVRWLPLRSWSHFSERRKSPWRRFWNGPDWPESGIGGDISRAWLHL